MKNNPRKVGDRVYDLVPPSPRLKATIDNLAVAILEFEEALQVSYKMLGDRHQGPDRTYFALVDLTDQVKSVLKSRQFSRAQSCAIGNCLTMFEPKTPDNQVRSIPFEGRSNGGQK